MAAALSALIVALLLAQSLLDWWVRRVDRQAGATLARRAAHPVQPGWRAVLGRPHAAFAVATFAGALVLAVSALPFGDATVRHAAVVLLIALAGVGLGAALQLRQLLARPVVAEDEVSLTADVIMRVEDAREITTPTVLWSLPVVLLFGIRARLVERRLARLRGRWASSRSSPSRPGRRARAMARRAMGVR